MLYDESWNIQFWGGWGTVVKIHFLVLAPLSSCSLLYVLLFSSLSTVLLCYLACFLLHYFPSPSSLLRYQCVLNHRHPFSSMLCYIINIFFVSYICIEADCWCASESYIKVDSHLPFFPRYWWVCGAVCQVWLRGTMLQPERLLPMRGHALSCWLPAWPCYRVIDVPHVFNSYLMLV